MIERCEEGKDLIFECLFDEHDINYDIREQGYSFTYKIEQARESRHKYGAHLAKCEQCRKAESEAK